ncbi:MAG TPA: retroviral-like aspartic protease family protein [Candidatus Limnocylindrales bacterium]|nr:retroviral-like aspartic protease family protein [Candidatus Limnocylindrales bacterium]
MSAGCPLNILYVFHGQQKACISITLLASILFGLQYCDAADSARAGTLEEYLKGLGYEAAEFERTEHAQDFVEGALGDGRKHTFLLDTGWGNTALSKSAARGLKQLNPAADSRVQLVDSNTNAEIVLMGKLTLGQVQFLNQPARVEELRADYIRLPFDAVLGCDFLFRNFCLIDCYKHRLYAHKTPPSDEQTRALETTLRLSGFAEVPIDARFLLTVETEINGQQVRLALDTGAACDEIDDSQLKRLGLTIIKSDQATTGSLIPQDMGAAVLGVGSIGRHGLKVTKVNTFRLGSHNWKNLYFGVADLKAWHLAKPGTEGEAVKGLLCQPTLAAHGALIDIARQKLWLRPEKPSR